MNSTERWRWVVASDILLHLTAIFFFALLPPNTLNPVEISAMALAVFAAGGVVLHAWGRYRLPWTEWAYLTAGFVCVYTLLAYELKSYGSIPAAISIPFGLFLFAGGMSSFAAHVIDGGQKRKQARGR